MNETEKRKRKVQAKRNARKKEMKRQSSAIEPVKEKRGYWFLVILLVFGFVFLLTKYKYEEIYLGVTYDYCNEESESVIVKSIDPDSPAEKAGLEVGDEIVAVNNKAVYAGNLKEVLSGFELGEEIVLMVSRQEEKEIIFEVPDDPRGFHQIDYVEHDKEGHVFFLGARMRETEEGLLVVDVERVSWFEREGLKKNDIIKSVGEQETNHSDFDLFNALIVNMGKTVVFKVSRMTRGPIFEKEIILGKKEANIIDVLKENIPWEVKDFFTYLKHTLESYLYF